MGADLIYYALSWNKTHKLNWKAGLNYIDKMPTSKTVHTKEHLKESLIDLQYVFEHGSRDTSIMEKGHLNILYTGGMSWGDSPSETFDLIADLEESGGIMEAIGFYQDDHDYKELLMKVLSLHKQICPTLLGLDPTLDKIVSDLLRKVPKKKRRSK